MMDWKGDILKIEIMEEVSCEETQIKIVCNHMDSSVLKILAMLRAFDRKITGIKGGETYLLEAGEILYIDTADKKTFFYTKDEVYETPFRLYEIKMNTIFSLILVFLFMSFMQSIAFTEIWIKKLHYGLRMMIFAFPSLAFMSLAAWKFGWFPIEEIGKWIVFIGIFCICFVISSIIYEIYFRMTGKKYDGLLGEYHKRREAEEK